MRPMDGTEKHLEALRAKWDSAIVARSHFDRFSGYAMSGKTIANLEVEGKGPKGKFFVGGKAAYSVDDALEFLRSRISVKGGE